MTSNTYNITSSSKELFEMLYYQYQEKFYDTSSKEIALEVIADDQTFINPAWNIIEQLHEENKGFTFMYKLGDKKINVLYKPPTLYKPILS